MRFLHTADWQLGMPARFLNEEARVRFTAARLDAVREIGRLAATEGCDFVVVCGDVFDHNHVDRHVLLRALDALADFSVPVYLLPGNHDPLDAGSIYHAAELRDAPPNVTLLNGLGPWPVPGGELVAAPWTSKRPLADLVDVACAALPADGTVRVAVGHGAVDVLSPDPDDPALIVLARLEQRLAAGALHYIALGDRHSLTSVGDSGRVWYPGAPEPTDYDEAEPGHVLVVDVDAERCDVTPVRVGTWSFLQPDTFQLRDADDVSELATWLEDQPDKERTVVRLRLVGTLSLRDKALLDEVLDHHGHLYAGLREWERHSDVAVLPDEDDLADLDLAGFAADALHELREAADGGPEADLAQEALALLYRLQRGVA